MNAANFISRFFRKNLPYWAFHGSMNALPSFCIAMLYLNLYQRPEAIAAMLAAVGCFILLYAVITSLPGPLGSEDHILARSLHLATKIRAWISLGSLVFMPFQLWIMLMPDFWCGLLAVGLIRPLFSGNPIESAAFGQIFVTTVVEGVILSFLLMLIAFFAVIYFQARARRKAYAGYTAAANSDG